MSRARSARDNAFAPASLANEPWRAALHIGHATRQHLWRSRHLLRRSFPYFVGGFLAAAALAATFQLLQTRRIALGNAERQLALLADLTAAKLDGAHLTARDDWQPTLKAAVPDGALLESRTMLLADSTGAIHARTPIRAKGKPNLLAILGPDQPLTTFGASAGVRRLSLTDGTDALVTVRSVGPDRNQIAVLQPVSAALADWRRTSHIEITVLLCGGLIMLLFGAALWSRPEDHAAEEEAAAAPDIKVADLAVAAAVAADANARLRDAVETISEAFVLWDGQNRLVMCNSKYQQFHGLSDDAVRQGTPYEAVIAAAHEPLIKKRITVDHHHDGSRSYEAQLEDGRWLHINEGPTRDGGYVSVGTDITQLKLSQRRAADNENQLRASISELNTSRRTLEQQKQQLAELAEKYAHEKNRAEAANRAKSEFLANISHELRTPLNAVIGFSEIMQSGLFGPLGHPKYAEYASDIYESGNFLLEVINDILDMSKIEAGRMVLEIERVDVADIIKESMKVVAKAAEARKVELTCDGPEAFFIKADRRALKQVFLNLLSNAVKFSRPEDRVEIRLSRSPGQARIAIRDTGIGIPEDEIDKLGKPFEQVENQFSKSHQGSGLGLAISRALVGLHGGSLTIESRQGEGTTVTCALPLRPPALPVHTVPARLKRLSA